MAPLHEIPYEEFKRVMSVNVDGVFLSMKYEINAMLKSGGGSIVNCGSVYGLTASPLLSPYITSKHALVGMTDAAAHESVTPTPTPQHTHTHTHTRTHTHTHTRTHPFVKLQRRE
jgi:NAD(P)-dependent dehydrogenase (short-subunit alcohol dehydrogenase family)